MTHVGLPSGASGATAGCEIDSVGSLLMASSVAARNLSSAEPVSFRRRTIGAICLTAFRRASAACAYASATVTASCGSRAPAVIAMMSLSPCGRTLTAACTAARV